MATARSLLIRGQSSNLSVQALTLFTRILPLSVNAWGWSRPRLLLCRPFLQADQLPVQFCLIRGLLSGLVTSPNYLASPLSVGRRRTPSAHSTDPALFLESRFEHIGDFLGGRLGPALDGAPATLFPVYFYPCSNDESRWVVCGK